MPNTRKTKSQSAVDGLQNRDSIEKTGAVPMSEADGQGSGQRHDLLALLENSDDCIVIADENGAPRRFNRAYAKVMKDLTGSEIESGIRPHKLFNDPEQVCIHDRFYERALKGEKFRAECRHRLSDDTVHFFEHSFCPIFREEKVVGYTEIFRDITDRKRLEEQVGEHEKIYRLLVENVNDLVFCMDPQGRFTYINPTVERKYGLARDEIIGKPFTDWVHEEDLAAAVESLRTREQGVEKPFEFRAKLKGGVHRWARVSSRPIYNNGILEGFCGVLTDITDIKSTESLLLEARDKLEEKVRKKTRELQKRERDYYELFQNATVGVFSSTRDGKLIAVNPKCAEIFGFESAESLLEEIDNAAMLYDDPDRRKELIEHLERDGVLKDKIGKAKRRDGEEIWLVANVSRAIRRGKVVYEGFLQDITERYKSEKELRRRARRLQDANTALNVLLEKREQDRKNFEEYVVSSMKSTVFPLMDKIGRDNLDNTQKALFQAVKANLGEIMSSFSQTITSSYLGLTPSEIQVASFVKQGHKTKEIADMLNLSYKTIESHREKIREKFGIKNKRINLRTYLLALE